LRLEREWKYGRLHDGSICASRPFGTALHVRETVETRARTSPTNGGTSKLNDERAWSPSPCLGLDVHKATTTATYLGPDGKTMRVWTFPTTRKSLSALTQEIDAKTPIVLEASTTGKAVATLLKEAGRELHMAAPKEVALIAKSAVKTDERDSAKLAHLYQAGFLPECYIPPPEIDRMRTLVHQRADLGQKVALVKNQVHALVSRNLSDEAMTTHSDWFGVAGLRALTALPLPTEERAALARYLRQLTYLATQAEELQRELAKVAVDREDVRLLMTIPGVDYYTAVALVGEIGEIERFATKQQLASYAGLVPRADNSGTKVSWHRSVKPGNLVLKRFLCSAVMGMLIARQETAIKRFYLRKAKQIGPAKARVAAARKLSAVVWWILSHREAYREQDEGLTERKEVQLDRKAARPVSEVSSEGLAMIGAELAEKVDALRQLEQDERTPLTEENREGNG
jgi:transposase